MKDNPENTHINVSRRNFIKTLSIGAGAAAISSLSSSEAKAISPNQVPKWDYEADVVILGTGFAGQVSAITAHDAGASVLMIEKAPEKHQGGNSRVCGQQIWCPSEAVLEDAFIYLKAMTAGTGYPVPDEYLWFYVRASHENKAWFESMGASMVPINRKPGTWVPHYPEFPGADAMASDIASYSVDGGMMGSGSTWNFLEDQIKRRKGVRKMYETPGKKLVQDPQTRQIRGVVGTRDQQDKYIKAKRAVIICSGGYEFNLQMIRDYIHIQDYASPGSPYNTGDGIKMSMAVGADLTSMGAYAAPWWVFCRVPDYLSHFYFVRPQKGGQIWVGADSKRYKDEYWEMPSGPWPGHKPTFCGMLKENGVYRREKAPMPIHAILDEEARLSGPLWFGAFAGQIEGYAPTKDNSRDIEKGYAIKADTIKELASKIGRDPDVLQETVNRWNEACAAGVDQEYGRKTNLNPVIKAPFFAINLIPSTINTQGGMLRNIESQVLDVFGDPIPRLYAAGEIGDRVWANLYECAKNVGAGCMAAGRKAGKNAAAEKPWA